MKKKIPFTCRDCGEIFYEKKQKNGFYNQCDICSLEQEDEEKYLGYNDGSLNKSTHISIYRGNDPDTRKKIRYQKNRV